MRGEADEYDTAIRAPQVVLEVMQHTTTGTHPGPGQYHRTTTHPVERHRGRRLAGEVQSRQGERICPSVEHGLDLGFVAVGVTTEDLRR